MATTAADRGTPAPRRGTARRTRRRASAPDTTALVDIALLLLMFFMVSTTWNTPQVLEMTLPPDNSRVPVEQVLAIAVQADGRLRCSLNGGEASLVGIDSLAAVVRAASLTAGGTSGIRVDADHDVTYGQIVDVLDELLLADAATGVLRNSSVLVAASATPSR